ncbi:hypothetical protein Tco_1470337 [Tanacetum coccineum]
MNPQETQQVATRDEQWVSCAERVKISSTNFILENIVPQKVDTSGGHRHDQEFHVLESFHYLCGCPRNLHAPILTTSNEKLRKSRIDILWGMFKRANVDYPALIWEDFAYQIDHRKEKRSRRENMPYLRFTKIIINYFLKQHKSLTNLNHKHLHTIKDDGIMFLKYFSHQIPPKKSRGKGSQGKKTADTPVEEIEVSKESDPQRAKRKTSSKRRVKKKVTLSTNDNIISDDPDVVLELAKSISQTEAQAEEAEAARKKSSGRCARSVVIQESLSTLKSKPATSKAKLKGFPSLTLEEQEPADIIQAFKEIISATLSEGIGTKPRVPDEGKVITEEKVLLEWGDEDDDDDDDDVDTDDKDGNDDDKGDDQDADDEDEETDDDDDIYKYKIRVQKDEDEEMKDAEGEESDKCNEEVTDATKEKAEKTSEVKDDAKKIEIPLSSSSLSVSFLQVLVINFLNFLLILL